MSEELKRLPERIYVTNETGNPGDSDIFDAETGKRVDGVFEVRVSRHEIIVEATPNWPPAHTDILQSGEPGSHDDPDVFGKHNQGLKTGTRTYHIKKLQLESW